MKGVNNGWISLDEEGISFYRRYYMSPDLLSSNSYIFRFPKCFLVIDPGGTEAHFNSVVSLIDDENVDGLPIFILLSHCHYDHVKALHLLPKEAYESYTIGAHVSAVGAMKEGSIDKTNSFLYTDKLPSVLLDFELFSESKNTPSLKFSTPEHDQQMVTLVGNGELIAYQTPGHSPCSVCYQIGNLLFVGDLFFAHYAAVLGIPGFSMPQLAKSLAFVKTIIREERIDEVYSGHGLPLSADRAIKLIDSIIKKLPSLKGVVSLNRPHFDILKECICAFMQDVDDHILANNTRLEIQNLETVLGDLPLHEKLDAYFEHFQKYLAVVASDPSMRVSSIPSHGLMVIKSLQAILKTLSVPSQFMLLYLERLELLFRTYRTLVGVDNFVSKTIDLGTIVGKCVDMLTKNNLSGSEPLSRATPEHLNALLGDTLQSLESDIGRTMTIDPISDAHMIGCKVASKPVWEMPTHKAKFYQLFTSLLDGKFIQYDDGHFAFLFPQKQ